MSVECLKLKLLLLSEQQAITFYLSELRLPKTEHVHPKEVWHKAQDYFKELLLGEFVQIKINGSEKYRDELNIHG